MFLSNTCLKLTSSISRASEGGGRVPSRVEDCDSDVIASSTPQLVDSVAVLVCRESSTSPSLSIADSSSSSSSLICSVSSQLTSEPVTSGGTAQEIVIVSAVAITALVSTTGWAGVDTAELNTGQTSHTILHSYASPSLTCFMMGELASWFGDVATMDTV